MSLIFIYRKRRVSTECSLYFLLGCLLLSLLVLETFRFTQSRVPYCSPGFRSFSKRLHKVSHHYSCPFSLVLLLCHISVFRSFFSSIFSRRWFCIPNACVSLLPPYSDFSLHPLSITFPEYSVLSPEMESLLTLRWFPVLVVVIYFYLSDLLESLVLCYDVLQTFHFRR